MERMAFSLAEVAETLGISPRSVINLIDSGALKAVRVGGLWRVAKVEIDSFLQFGTPPPPGQARRGFKRGVKHRQKAKADNSQTIDLPGMESPVAQANTATAISRPLSSKPKSRNAIKQAAYRARQKAKKQTADADASDGAGAKPYLETNGDKPTPEAQAVINATRDAPRTDSSREKEDGE